MEGGTEEEEVDGGKVEGRVAREERTDDTFATGGTVRSKKVHENVSLRTRVS